MKKMSGKKGVWKDFISHGIQNCWYRVIIKSRLTPSQFYLLLFVNSPQSMHILTACTWSAPFLSALPLGPGFLAETHGGVQAGSQQCECSIHLHADVLIPFTSACTLAPACPHSQHHAPAVPCRIAALKLLDSALPAEEEMHPWGQTLVRTCRYCALGRQF